MKSLRRFRVALLVAVVLFGAYLRFSNLNWDEGFQFHPDERGILFIAQSITNPHDGNLLSRQSPLNPLFDSTGAPTYYAYGHFHLYSIVAGEVFLRASCQAVVGLCPEFLIGASDAAYSRRLLIAGRILSALADTLTIIGVTLLAKRLFDDGLGAWFACAAAATAVIHIQNAHFGTVDSQLALYSTIGIFGLVSYAQTSRSAYSILSAVAIALALGCKSTAILLLIPFVLTHFSLTRQQSRLRTTFNPYASRSSVLTALGLITITFLTTNPFAALYPIEFLGNTMSQARMASGLLDWPFTRQYLHTTPVIYQLTQLGRWQLGLPLTIAILGGLIWAVIRFWRYPSQPLLIALSWPLVVLILLGLQFVKFPRYLMPALPILFVLAGGMVSDLTSQLRRNKSIVRLTVVALIIVPTALYALFFHTMYLNPHPWITASEWIYRTIPQGSRIAGERWDDRLPVNMVLDGKGYVAEDVYLMRTTMPFVEPDDLVKIEVLADTVAESDYLVIASNRLYGTIPRLIERYPLTAAYYRLLFEERLGFELIETFSRYPHWGGYQLVDNTFNHADLPTPSYAPDGISLGFADESFTVYDHPLVLIFVNRDRLTQSEIVERILSESESPRFYR